MLDTIRELINFYSQKFHLSIMFATQEWQINSWQEEGILIAMPMDGNNPSFGESIKGEEIKVKNKPVAKIGKQFLILLFHPKNKTAETLARKLIDEAIPKMARYIRQQQLKQFLDSMRTVAENIKRNKENAIHSDQWEIDRLSQQIYELSRKMEADRMTIKFFELSEDHLKQKAIRMYIDLQKLVPGLYSIFKFEGDKVIGTTQPIYITFKDYEYRFDPYQVKVNIQEGKVHIEGNQNDVNDYIHPHISDNICWGNISAAIHRMIGQVELHGLFSLIHNFLGSYNADDPYQRIEKWNPDWEDEDDYSDEPYCLFCDDYGHEVEQCDYCHWCDDCDQWVDHPEDECPTRKEAEHEQAA